MAYNPFNIFRRNQKAIFAVITVFIMFTFVLSSGLGGGADFFDWLPRWLGQKSKKGDVVCSIDGGKVYSSELEQLRFNRVMANRFMNQAALFTRAGLENEVEELTPRVSPETKRVLDSIRQQEGFLHLMGPEAQSMVQQMYFTLQRGVINSPIAKAEDKRAAGMKQLSLSLLQSLLAGGSENHYFSNMPNRTNRDLVNFLLWQKKADQLGISFTTDDVKRLIDKEFHGIFRGQLEVEVRKNLQRDMANFNLNRCIEAIGEEFRVRMAQVAVLGPVAHGSRADMTYGGFPMFGTSYEAFDFYRDQCSPTTYGTIPVPVINFLPLVPEPDESNPQTRAELIDLYDKYKNDEPNLGREAPGLKEPRKIKIEWLSVTGSEPYYVKFAEELLQQGELQAKVGSMLTVPLLGASPMFMAAATAPIAVKEPLVLAAYDSVIREHQFSLSDRYDTANFSLARLMPSSIVRPGVLVGAAGHAAGQALAFGHPLATIAKTAVAPFAYEVRDRVKTGLPAVLLALGSIPSVKTEVLGLSIGQPVPGPLPGPALFANLMGAHVAYEMMLPKPLPIDAVKPELMKNLTATTAKNIAFGEPVNPARPAPPGPPKKGDLQTFIDEVNKLSDNGKVRPSDKDKFAALQKYITEFAAKRGLTITGNKTPLSEWKLEEDPNLATLVTAQKESLKRSPHQQQAEYIPFANSFFWDQGDRRRPTTGVYKADFYPEQRQQFRDPTRDETKPQYLTWRTEEVAAKVPSSFDEAKPAVKAVWKHQKARELAKARAEKLAETIRAGTASSEATVLGPLLDQSNVLAAEFAKDPVARDRIMPFLVEGVCPLTTVSNPTANKGLIPSFASSLPSQMHDFRLPPSENVKYPSRDMGLKLLDERTKPVKTVLVLTDEPKDIYYVTTLMKREEKQSWEFQNLLRQGAGGNQNVVLGNYIGQGRDKTIASVMGLLKKEFKYEETEEQKKKLDERRSGE